MYFNIPGHDTMIYKFLGLPSFTNTKTMLMDQVCFICIRILDSVNVMSK